MGHGCVDWGATLPTRKVPYVIFSYGDRHLYAPVPQSFDVRSSHTVNTLTYMSLPAGFGRNNEEKV